MLPGKQGTCAALPANETIAALAEKYPRCFALLETKRRPLANRIHDALLATVAPDERGTILFALRIYTSNMRYLARCVENAPRIDLSGKIAGRVTAREAHYAARILARRRTKSTNGRIKTSPPQAERSASASLRPKHGTLTLAGLKASAVARRTIGTITK